MSDFHIQLWARVQSPHPDAVRASHEPSARVLVDNAHVLPTAPGVPATGGEVSLDALVNRVREIAALSPTEFAERMGNEETSEIGQLYAERNVEPRSLLRSWDKIGRASSAPLSDQAYARFLNGQHPDVTVDELYGAHLSKKRTGSR
jgi:hypothetical protein